MKHIVDFFWRKRGLTLHPPIQHENECRSQVLNQQIRQNLARSFSVCLNMPSHVFGNQFSEYLRKVFMNNGSPLGPHDDLAAAPMPIDMLEDRQTEPYNLLIPLRRGWEPRRLH